MIINGGARRAWRFFAAHLMKATDNEYVAVKEMRGLASDTVLGGLREMDALASGTRCTNFFYHANLNPRADELLNPAQWAQAIDTLEHQLGLDGQARIVVEHRKAGRSHHHVIWSRIDTDRMTAIPDSRNYAAHERTARALEAAFGHASVTGAHGRAGKRPPRRAKGWETFRGHGSGLDPATITREVTALWQQADTGQAFAASLAAHGYQLCKGDRRDFCLVDAAGDVHSLARRIDGAKAAEIRARMAAVDRAALPSAAEVKPIVPVCKREQKKEAEPAPLSPLDAFARDMAQVMRANGGDPHMADGLTWLERSVTVLETARAQVTGWVRGQWQNLVAQFHPGRDSGHDPGRER